MAGRVPQERHRIEELKLPVAMLGVLCLFWFVLPRARVLQDFVGRP